MMPMKRNRNRQRASAPQSMDSLMATACRLAESEDISAVHVVSSERPTYGELLRYHRWADGRDLKLVVDASSVSFRSSSLHDPDSAVEARDTSTWPGGFITHVPWRAALRDYSHGLQPAPTEKTVSSALDWLSAHGRAWYAEFNLMTEGTR
jgi:hypothetical protein